MLELRAAALTFASDLSETTHLSLACVVHSCFVIRHSLYTFLLLSSMRSPYVSSSWSRFFFCDLKITGCVETKSTSKWKLPFQTVQPVIVSKEKVGGREMVKRVCKHTSREAFVNFSKFFFLDSSYEKDTGRDKK